MRSHFLWIFAAATVLLGGCTYFRLPISQGNVVMAETAETIEPGMSREDVHEKLGTPLVADSFGASRWDYVIFYRDTKGKETRQTLSVYFENDVVSRVQGLENFRKAAPATGAAPGTTKPTDKSR